MAILRGGQQMLSRGPKKLSALYENCHSSEVISPPEYNYKNLSGRYPAAAPDYTKETFLTVKWETVINSNFKAGNGVYDVMDQLFTVAGTIVGTPSVHLQQYKQQQQSNQTKQWNNSNQTVE